MLSSELCCEAAGRRPSFPGDSAGRLEQMELLAASLPPLASPELRQEELVDQSQRSAKACTQPPLSCRVRSVPSVAGATFLVPVLPPLMVFLMAEGSLLSPGHFFT